MTESQWYSKVSHIKSFCMLGMSHFCDGTPNRSEGGVSRVKPCVFFKNGVCTMRAINNG